MADVSAELMEKSNLKSEDIAYLVPHQANMRIIDATGKRMNLPNEKVMINIQKYGNTTAATLPLLLWDYEKKLNSQILDIKFRVLNIFSFLKMHNQAKTKKKE